MSKLTFKSALIFSTFQDREGSKPIHQLYLKYTSGKFHQHILCCVAQNHYQKYNLNNPRSSHPYLKSQQVNLTFPLSQTGVQKKDIIAWDCKWQRSFSKGGQQHREGTQPTMTSLCLALVIATFRRRQSFSRVPSC